MSLMPEHLRTAATICGLEATADPQATHTALQHELYTAGRNLSGAHTVRSMCEAFLEAAASACADLNDHESAGLLRNLAALAEPEKEDASDE